MIILTLFLSLSLFFSSLLLAHINTFILFTLLILLFTVRVRDGVRVRVRVLSLLCLYYLYSNLKLNLNLNPDANPNSNPLTFCKDDIISLTPTLTLTH
jgi:hypothetical protein